jgi:inositol phosphorylceramide mannosyltransferase catalytic subunit
VNSLPHDPNSPATGGGIPRRIIQTGKTARLPLLEQAAAANLKLLNPDFEYCFFDNQQVEAFLDQRFPQYRAVFDKFRFPIQRYDFFRYLAVYGLGGFYFDTDVFLARALEPLLPCRAVFPFEELTLARHLRDQHGMDWEAGNYAFGAEAGHPFLKAIIENCVQAQKDPSWAEPMMKGIPLPFRGQFEVTNSTGPGTVTRTLAENPALRQTVTILFPHDVCDESSWHRFGDYGVHLMHGSWRKKDSFVRARLARFWEVRRRTALARESERLGAARPGAWRTVQALSL